MVFIQQYMQNIVFILQTVCSALYLFNSRCSNCSKYSTVNAVDSLYSTDYV